MVSQGKVSRNVTVLWFYYYSVLPTCSVLQIPILCTVYLRRNIVTLLRVSNDSNFEESVFLITEKITHICSQIALCAYLTQRLITFDVSRSKPVSYTHLDVYKRQILPIAIQSFIYRRLHK